jgi:hypothetical protein
VVALCREITKKRREKNRKRRLARRMNRRKERKRVADDTAGRRTTRVLSKNFASPSLSFGRVIMPTILFQSATFVPYCMGRREDVDGLLHAIMVVFVIATCV